MKRFTETEKWSDPWFRKLQPDQKLLWIYLLDKCDGSGVIDPDEDLVSFLIGLTVNIKELVRISEGRIVPIQDGKFWITKFVHFQNGELSEHCKPHVYVIKLLKKHRLWKGYAKGMHTLKEQEREKDPEREQEQGKEQVTVKGNDVWDGL